MSESDDSNSPWDPNIGREAYKSEEGWMKSIKFRVLQHSLLADVATHDGVMEKWRPYFSMPSYVSTCAIRNGGISGGTRVSLATVVPPLFPATSIKPEVSVPVLNTLKVSFTVVMTPHKIAVSLGLHPSKPNAGLPSTSTWLQLTLDFVEVGNSVRCVYYMALLALFVEGVSNYYAGFAAFAVVATLLVSMGLNFLELVIP